jgi:hypothetical protein
MDNLVAILTIFALGFISGFFSHKYLMKFPLTFDQDARINWLILLVSFVWAASVLYSLVNVGYQTPLPIHGIMGAIVGFFFWRPNPPTNVPKI